MGSLPTHSKPSKSIPMRKLTATLCLTLTILLGSAGVSARSHTAVKWFKLAAEQGLANAQFNLGVMYENGQGVPKNDETAVMWYRLSAEQGYANA